tara:strand:+ start:1139 stop:2083 length:945 start_codon:yes stop_codon:yes gene_type:complete
MSSEDSKEVKKDYLEVDESIPGQQYACLSFVSPEALIKKKDAFTVSKFLQSYCKEQKMKFEEVYSKYEDFCYKFKDELQRDFDEQNDFQTSIRGVKIRGVYNTKDEAEARAKKLSTLDSSFHVFVGQVGYWLPWDPNADGVESEVFQNSQLNDMMEKYEENNINRDIFYEEQKRDKIAAAKEEAEKKRREQLEEERKNKKEVEDKTYDLDDSDPVKEVDESIEVSESKEVEGLEPEKETETEEIETKIDSSLKNSLESADPWLAKKLEESAKVVDDVKEVVEGVKQVVEDVKEVLGEPEPEPVDESVEVTEKEE